MSDHEKIQQAIRQLARTFEAAGLQIPEIHLTHEDDLSRLKLLFTDKATMPNADQLKTFNDAVEIGGVTVMEYRDGWKDR